MNGGGGIGGRKHRGTGGGGAQEVGRGTGAGLTCSNVAVSVFVIIEWVVTGIRRVPW